jgi:hypothetical protein
MERKKEEDEREANAMLAGGATVAVLGIVGAITSGAICPVCVVTVPVLLGVGVARKVRAARRRPRAKDVI